PEAYRKARVRAYALPGIRQTRWIVGQHHLTTEEVRAATMFPDAVARTSWPVELHGDATGYRWEPFGDDHIHSVPLRS
ncbi:FAD-dependent oxidoreductase, partial [Mycobacterium tuberculosis]